MARYALVIGISKYDKFTHLPKAATDAEAIAQLLEQHRYTVIRLPRKLVSESQWAIDPDKKLTAAELSTELKTFLRDRATRQEVVIYFAGHGFRVTDTLTDDEVGYLATSDSTKDGQNAVRVDALNTLLSKSDLGSLVMLLDCCYAGTLIEQRSLLQPTQGIISQKQNYCLIAACRDFERAREGEQHGIFTAAVLRGLSAENASNGDITSTDLLGFISRVLQPSGQEVIHAGMGQSIPLVAYQPTQAAGASEQRERLSRSGEPPPTLPKQSALLRVVIVLVIAVVGVGVIALFYISNLIQNPLDILQSSDLDKIAEKMPAIKQWIDEERQKVDTLPMQSDSEGAIADYNARKEEINKSLVLHQLFLQKVADLRENGKLNSENSSHAQDIENSLALVIHKYRIPFLAVDLQQRKFGKLNEESEKTDLPDKQFTPGALRTTYEILMTESGAHADLYHDGTIKSPVKSNPREADQIPCTTLIEIRNLWKKATDQKCDWYGEDINNPHFDSECERELRKHSIHSRASTIATIFSENYPDELVSRVKYCEEKLRKTNN